MIRRAAWSTEKLSSTRMIRRAACSTEKLSSTRMIRRAASLTSVCSTSATGAGCVITSDKRIELSMCIPHLLIIISVIFLLA